jgi:hypothetical protein
MNTDGYRTRRKIREQNFKNNMLSSQVKCSDINEYAEDQHATYDRETNQILYGTDTNLKALGVSNGTCNQTNIMIPTNRYKCGLGTAGGNPCVPDSYNYKFEEIEGYDSDNSSSSNFGGSQHDRDNIIEEFEVLNRRVKTTEVIIAILAILFLLMLRYCD